MTLMPALFIGHGSPMNTLESNGYTDAWFIGDHAFDQDFVLQLRCTHTAARILLRAQEEQLAFVFCKP